MLYRQERCGSLLKNLLILVLCLCYAATLELQALPKESLSILEFVEKKRMLVNNRAIKSNPVPKDILITYVLYDLSDG